MSVLAPKYGEPADLLHLDVMDGHFVPNVTMGPALCRSLRQAFPKTLLDVHLMVTNPQLYIEPFARAGANHLTFHIEPAVPHYRSPTGAGGGLLGKGYDVEHVAEATRAAGMTAGLAINPPTPFEHIEKHIPAFDMILVMSVNPGFSGQAFIADSLNTTRCVRELLRDDQRLEMDGGVSTENAASVREAGCDVLVAASAIFNRPADERGNIIASLRHGPME